ncbi:MAG: HD domain-containing protein [Oscillospiraceae bacterium]|jgi:putative nucleotidyltransferase with HDIG domain|nr:HD domain-containing protein [Oscillospiraceae bacterium]
MFDKEQAKDVFLRYAEAYDTQNILISHKIEHTFRVATLSERYAKALGMCAEDTALAWFLGLLHDIGRFEQVRRFGTFVDSQSVDHAELSGDILFRDGLLDRFPEEGLPEAWKETAEISIRQHNKLRLPDGLDARTLSFAELLRDADKTDIFRVIASIPFEDRVGSSKASFQDTMEASPEVMACVYEHRCVPARLRHSHFEGRVSHCCMAFELVFEVSRRTVKEEGYLRILLAETDAEGNQIWTDRETEQLRILRHEIEKAWGVSF